MLSLDETLFGQLLKRVSIRNKNILDIGCGTGRHWTRLYDEGLASLSGYDVSAGMLKILKKKFPNSLAWKINGTRLVHTADNTIDILVSTLTIAHINNVDESLNEWNRVLKPGGYVIITDYHPVALEKGGNRTFSFKGKTVAIRNNIHPISMIKQIGSQCLWETIYFEEKVIDDTLKPFYEKKNALSIFESFKGVPIIYGIIFKKDDP